MRITPTAEFMLEPVLDAGSSRDAIGLGQAAGPGLNTRHGKPALHLTGPLAP